MDKRRHSYYESLRGLGIEFTKEWLMLDKWECKRGEGRASLRVAMCKGRKRGMRRKKEGYLVNFLVSDLML